MDLNLPTSSTPRTDDEDNSSSSTSSSTEPLLSPKGSNWVPGAKKKKSSKKKSSSSSTRRGERKNSSKDLGIDLISVPDICTFETEIEAEKCPTTKALVFSDRVEVTRAIKVPSISGRGEILVSGLPASIVSESLRTNCTSGNAVILEVSFETRPVIVPPGQEAQIHTEIKALKKQITVKSTEYEAFKKQRELYEIFLKRVEDLPKQSLAAKLPRFTDVDQVSNFFRFSERYEQSITVIDQKLLEIQQELAELNTRLNINKDTVSTLKLRVNETKKVLCISLYAPTQGDVEMDLSYVISGASWKPYYDMRIISAEKKMEVNFYGIITQSTEENWKDVKLSLSTAVPQFDGSCPKLTAATLSLEEKFYYKSDFMVPSSSSSSAYSQRIEFADEDAGLRLDDFGGAPPGGGRSSSAKSSPPPPPPPKMVVATAEVAESHTSATFGIPRTTTIPNDGKPHKVTIAILTIPIDLKFVVRPRISSHAFLEINATNDSVYPLLTGTANIFFDNSFLCSTTLPEDTSPQNKFKLFAGADDSVKVELLPVVLKTETSGLLTKVKIDTAEYITVIKNTKPVTISVLLEDQLPISTEDKIKVKLIEPDLSKMPNVKLDPRTNHVEWDITLPPDAQIRLPFKFHVEYPRDRALTLDDEE